MSGAVNHPAHYGGADNPYEAIKVIEAWNLGFCLGNAVKYISRAGKKSVAALSPARRYLGRPVSPASFPRCANFIAAIREFVRGEIPEARSLQYAGHHHQIADLICKVCRADIHDKGETCSLQKDALCSTCAQFVPLDYYGKCVPSGERWRYHEIVTSTIRPRIQHAVPTQPPNGEMVMSSG